MEPSILLSPDIEALSKPCVSNEPPGDPHRGRADRLELHDLNELGEQRVPGILHRHAVLQGLGLEGLDVLGHGGGRGQAVAVLRPHHEDVAGVRLQVGHGVCLGVDPVECYLVPHCVVLLSAALRSVT